RGIVARGRPAEIEVVAIRKNPAVPLPRGRGKRLGAAPGLNGDVLWQAGVEDFVPANHALAVLGHNSLEPLAEIRLQRLIVLKAVGAHVFLNLLVAVPLLAIHLIAADVKEQSSAASVFQQAAPGYCGQARQE